MNRDVELILSSGFLAFAHHSAFLALQKSSSHTAYGNHGDKLRALAGAMFAAGYNAKKQ